MLAADYPRAVRRWMTNASLVAFFLVAVGVWYSIAQGNVMLIFLVAWPSFMLVGVTFLLVTLYYFVLGYLSNRQGASTSPTRD